MKIESVIVKTSVVINGEEHTIQEVDWTGSCQDACQDYARDGRSFSKEDAIDWVTTH